MWVQLWEFDAQCCMIGGGLFQLFGFMCFEIVKNKSAIVVERYQCEQLWPCNKGKLESRPTVTPDFLQQQPLKSISLTMRGCPLDRPTAQRKTCGLVRPLFLCIWSVSGDPLDFERMVAMLITNFARIVCQDRQFLIKQEQITSNIHCVCSDFDTFRKSGFRHFS